MAADDSDDNGVSIAADRLTLDGGTIQDGANRDAALTHGAVADARNHLVDGVKPTLESITAGGKHVVLAYGEALDNDSEPSAASFVIRIGSAKRNVTGVGVKGSTATLTLVSAADLGQSVHVTYGVPGTSPLSDRAGNAAAAFANQAATIAFPMDSLDVTGDGEFNADDALAMFYAYRLGAELGDGSNNLGTEQNRKTVLSGLVSKGAATDSELKGVLVKANAWAAQAEGADLNGDGRFDDEDALVLYYALRLATLVGDGAAGGLARYQAQLLESLWGQTGKTPDSTDLLEMVWKASLLREAVR